MNQDGIFNDDISKMNSSPKKKIDDFTSFKDHTMDFLNHEQSYASEKIDAEKPKVDADDFLNFHDDIGEAKQPSPAHIPSFETFEEPKVTQPEPEIDFHALDDEEVAAPNLKGLKKPQNETFISSEDLVTDYKDIFETEASKFVEIPATIPKFVEIPKHVEAPKQIEVPKPAEAPVVKQPPVTASLKSVEEPVKPKTAPPPAPVKKTTSDGTQIEAEKFFKNIGLDAWFKPERLHPKVESLIYWRDIKKSGVVFGIGLAVLLAMSLFSLISVFAYLSLMILGGTIAFRVYKTVMGAVQKTSEGHPFKEILDIDLTMQPEKVQNVAGVAVTHINAYVAELRRLFLVEDLVDSLKFALLLWLLTYIGAIFNGMTVVILSYIAMFTLPKVYETNKQNIDQYLDLVRSKIMEITDKVKAAIPIGGAKKEESAKDK